MSICFDCGKVNPDYELEEAKQAAKRAAINAGEAQALYKEDGEYKYIPASFALANGFPVITILSPYQ